MRYQVIKVEEYIKDKNFPFLISPTSCGLHWLAGVMEAYRQQPFCQFFYWYKEGSPAVIQSHYQEKRKNVIFLYRDREAAISRDLQFHGTADTERSRAGLRKLFDSYLHYLDTAQLVLKIEEINLDPIKEFRRLIEYLGLGFDEAKLILALAKAEVLK